MENDDNQLDRKHRKGRGTERVEQLQILFLEKFQKKIWMAPWYMQHSEKQWLLRELRGEIMMSNSGREGHLWNVKRTQCGRVKRREPAVEQNTMAISAPVD